MRFVRILAITALLLTASLCFGRTIIQGEIITENTWWTEANSPYVLTNDVVVAPNARLTIEPGVEVLIEKPIRVPPEIEQLDNLDSFTVAIKVFGTIHAVGTPIKPVVFRGVNVEDNFSHWYGIFIRSARSQESTIGYATISSAAQGVRVFGGLPMIRNTLFEFNNIGVRVENRSAVRIVHCIFSKNFLAGVRVYNSNPFIFNSIIVDNNMIGVWGDSHTEISFRNNLVFGNGRDFSQTDPLFGKNDRTNANGDSTDYAGNLSLDPVFLGTVAEETARNSGRPPRRASSASMLQEIIDRRFVLSPFSPAIDAGTTDRGLREVDGTAPDIGIWGGPEVISF